MSKRKFDDDVFDYVGNGQTIPKDVVSVRIHPSIVKIEDEAFNRCEQLKEVVFNSNPRRREQFTRVRCMDGLNG